MSKKHVVQTLSFGPYHILLWSDGSVTWSTEGPVKSDGTGAVPVVWDDGELEWSPSEQVQE